MNIVPPQILMIPSSIHTTLLVINCKKKLGIICRQCSFHCCNYDLMVVICVGGQTFGFDWGGDAVFTVVGEPERAGDEWVGARSHPDLWGRLQPFWRHGGDPR